MRGRIARPLQQLGDRRQLRIEPVRLTQLRILRARPGDADEIHRRGKTPGHEARARRRADRCGVVELRHQHAFARESIEIGRPDLGVAHYREIAEAHVVDEDEQNVGRPLIGWRRRRRCGRGLRRSGGQAGRRAQRGQGACKQDAAQSMGVRHVASPRRRCQGMKATGAVPCR